MTPFIAEFIGTTILILLGDGVVANVLLHRTKGAASGWIVITLGWGLAVFVGVFCVSRFSGAHLNPAVTIALASAGKFPWGSVPAFVLAQLLGGMAGALLVYLFYRPHFNLTDDPDLKLAVFCTSPNVRDFFTAFFCETLGTFLLVFAIFQMPDPGLGLGALGALPVGLVVLAIGLSLGGTTGYAINPARDLGPRLIHALLPIPGKRDSDWGYAWIPVLAPVAGGLLASAACKAFI